MEVRTLSAIHGCFSSLKFFTNISFFQTKGRTRGARCWASASISGTGPPASSPMALGPNSHIFLRLVPGGPCRFRDAWFRSGPTSNNVDWSRSLSSPLCANFHRLVWSLQIPATSLQGTLAWPCRQALPFGGWARARPPHRLAGVGRLFSRCDPSLAWCIKFRHASACFAFSSHENRRASWGLLEFDLRRLRWGSPRRSAGFLGGWSVIGPLPSVDWRSW